MKKIEAFFGKVFDAIAGPKPKTAPSDPTDPRGQVVKELTHAMDKANAVPPTDKDIPRVLVPVLGHTNRQERRLWIKRHRKLWNDAWRYERLQDQIKAEGK